MQLLEIIERIREKFTDPIDVPQIETWEKEVNRLLVVEAVAQTDGIQLLVKELQKEVQHMNKALLSQDSTSLPDKKRDIVLERKKLYKRVLAYFDVEASRERIEKELTNNI